MNSRELIASGARIPDFSCETLDQKQIGTRHFYLRKNLLLVFLHEWPCTECLAYLRSFIPWMAALQMERTQLLAVLPLGEVVPLGPDLHEIPFPVGLTEGATIHSCYALLTPGNQAAAAVLLADETGTLWQIWLEQENHALPSPSELVEWASYIARQCPECWERPWWEGPS